MVRGIVHHMDPRAFLRDPIKGKGWVPESPSSLDWLLNEHPKASAVPGSPAARRPRVDHRPVAPPVRNQGPLGSCVGESLANAVGFLRRTDPDVVSTTYSSLFAYYFARIGDGMQWKDIDAGAYIRDGVNALRHVGIPPESRWPFEPHRFAHTPPPSAISEASRWKLGAHWRCNTLEDILKALDMGFAVVGGISCYSNLFTAQVFNTGVIPMPRGSFEGGHAMWYAGYDMASRYLFAYNSWGDDVGDRGTFYLPFAYAATRSLSSDWWALEKESPDTWGYRRFMKKARP